MEKPKTYCEAVMHFDKSNLHRIYHDTAYGFPIADDNELFERLILEINGPVKLDNHFKQTTKFQKTSSNWHKRGLHTKKQIGSACWIMPAFK